MDINDIEIEPEQEELIAILVAAEQSQERKERQEFIYHNFKAVTVVLENPANWGTSTNITVRDVPLQVDFSSTGTAKVNLQIGASFYGISGYRVPHSDDQKRILALKSAAAPVEKVPLETACGVIFHPKFQDFIEVSALDIDFLREIDFLRFSNENEFAVSAKGLFYHRRLQSKGTQSSHSGSKESGMPNQNNSSANDSTPFRVFISHSSLDKPFVRRLAEDLKKQAGLNVWADEKEMQVGDSIVQGVSSGLKDTDYVVIVLSPRSVQSRWVQAELDTALMSQLSGQGGVTILPVIIETCDVPVLLKTRIYADFRENYEQGLERLLKVFGQEKAPTASQSAQPDSHDCTTHLTQLKPADLRRLITKKLSLADVGTVWFDTLGSKLENEMPQRSLQECVIELLIRADQRSCMTDLIHSLCQEHPHLANPH